MSTNDIIYRVGMSFLIATYLLEFSQNRGGLSRLKTALLKRHDLSSRYVVFSRNRCSILIFFGSAPYLLGNFSTNIIIGIFFVIFRNISSRFEQRHNYQNLCRLFATYLLNFKSDIIIRIYGVFSRHISSF
jgi:hypothetical protein